MYKKNERTRKLPLIGKRRFEFDLKLEKNIYCCLCCSHGSRRILKKIDNEFKFNTYHQWKQYINKKYEKYNRNDLIEFSRYLNQNIRGIKPLREFWDLFIPVILTILLTYAVNDILKPVFTGKFFSLISVLVLFILSFFIIIIPIIAFIWKVFVPILDNSIEENFFIDYKEIIDEMIEKIGQQK